MVKETETLPNYIPDGAKEYAEKVRAFTSKPYLILPFYEQKYLISEGWFYSPEEYAIHGSGGHAGVDFALSYGTKVLAASDGWAMASYFRRRLLDHNGQIRMYQGKPVEMGLGYFVQIYHPKVDRYTIYAHLSELNNVPFSPARRRKNGDIVPVNINRNPKDMGVHSKFTWVEQGQCIGRVGDSGLCWGYDDYPKRPDRDQYPSYDEVHLHFEEFGRKRGRRGKGTKSAPRDPYDIYWTGEKYPDTERTNHIGINSLWVLNEDRMPQFASFGQ